MSEYLFGYETKIVATGTWLYDGVTPMKVDVLAKPARFASSRYDDDDQLDESRPIPVTIDGFLYFCPDARGDYLTIDEAKAAVDRQPWGPVVWTVASGL